MSFLQQRAILVSRYCFDKIQNTCSSALITMYCLKFAILSRSRVFCHSQIDVRSLSGDPVEICGNLVGGRSSYIFEGCGFPVSWVSNLGCGCNIQSFQMGYGIDKPKSAAGIAYTPLYFVGSFVFFSSLQIDIYTS